MVELAETQKYGPNTPAVEEPARRTHYAIVNASYMGSGRDGDPWVMTSWDVKPCTCDRPWRHPDGIRA